MRKELNIKVNINSSFEVYANPNLKDWNDASIEEQNIYVKNCVQEFLLEQIDEIVDELMNGSKIEF